MKNVFVVFFFVFCFSIILQGQQQQDLCVLPEPREYGFSNERFLLNDQFVQLKQFCKEYLQLNTALEELSLTAKVRLNLSISKQNNSDRRVLLGIPKEDISFKQICQKYHILPEEELGDEGYCLLINSEAIIISANDQRGLFYGIQTLKQIIRGIKDRQQYIPGIKITDWPTMKYRAVMDDISRGPVPTMDFIKYQIRRLSEMKINTFMHYVEHVVKTKSHPEFAPEDGSLSIEDWKELSEYASKYNITLAGNFQSFGHFNNILSTPEYAHLGESGTLISPVNPESYRFLEDIYTEMIPAFKAPFFNINCDETFDLGKGASKRLVDSIGYAETYYMHIMRLYESLKKLNMKVMLWGDVLLEHTELLSKLPKDIVIATWTYDNLESYSKFIDPITQAGFKFFVTPGVLNSNRLYPNFRQAFGNIKGFADAAETSGALGMITTVWDDGGMAFFSNDWYGVAYSADKAWNTKSKDSAGFDIRFNTGLYGSDNNKYTEAIQKLCELSDYESTDGSNDKVLFEKLLPDSGKTARISSGDWEKVYFVCDTVQRILQGCDPKVYGSDIEYLQFTAELYKALARERLDLLKASNCYLLADSLLRSDPAEARRSILRAISLTDGIIEKEFSIKNTYEELWFKENRTYALNRVSDNYKKKIDDYNDLKVRLTKSLQMLDSSLPILSERQVRLSITPLTGKYFREWLMVNPIPNKDKQSPSKIDYLAQIGGEKKAHPKVTQEFYFDSLKYRWSRVASPYQDAVNLSEIFNSCSFDAVTYAFATIETPKDTILNCLLGCTGTMEVILNGEKIFQKGSTGKLITDEYSFMMPVKKGMNNLMLKTSRINDQWGFIFRITDCEVRSRKNRYKIISQ